MKPMDHMPLAVSVERVEPAPLSLDAPSGN
jgi:hypothetical protein